MAEFAFHTGRLTLRQWRESDIDAFHSICSDPTVMRFLGPLMSRDDIAPIVARQNAIQREHGHCFWVLERREDDRMIGFCGLQPGPAGTPIFNKIEIGWRLAFDCWGQGYAREAAQACLNWGWAHLDQPDIWAITVQANTNSWGLMKRIGMHPRPDLDFDHPNVPDESPLKRHVTWTINRPIGESVNV